MRLTQKVEVTQNIDINLDVDDIYNNLSLSEKKDLLELLISDRRRGNINYRNYYVEDLLTGVSDTEFLTSKKIWDEIIKLVKYENSDLLDYIIEELNY